MALAGLLALDIVGGIVTNATSSAKRWYHRSDATRWHHFAFVSLHAIQLGLVALVFRDMDWGYFGFFYSLLMTGGAILLLVPRYLQRPIGFLLFTAVILVDRYAMHPTPGLEWFIPLFFLKLFLSHLLVETAYRPKGARAP